MNHWRLARRVGFAVLAAMLVISFVFGFVMLSEDPNEALIAHGMANSGASVEEIQQAIEEYREDRGRLAPWYVQYGRWVVRTATLDWGVSPNRGVAVTELLAQRLPITAIWVLPGMAISVVGGIAIGLYSALRQHTLADRAGTTLTYLGLSLPNYWLAAVVPTALGVVGLAPTIRVGPEVLVLGGFDAVRPLSVNDVLALSLPSLVLASSLLASQAQTARAEALEFVTDDFVKLVRARGASRWAVARHVGRNAAIPLLSLFFADMLGVLVINVFVLETVFGIPGIGPLALQAFSDRDLPILLGVTTVIMFVGVFGTLVQDLAYDFLDPRVDSLE